MSAYSALDAVGLAQETARGKRSASENIEAAFDAVKALDSELNVFLNTNLESARALARVLDAAPAETRGPLHGVPIALKANMCVEGFESNCASRILAGYHAPYTATFVRRLVDAGAIPIGMTNMDEFAMGSSCENSAFGPSKNPWDETRTAGGSSSGSAVAVAAGITPIALGSDTGGSVRQPAALTGIVGFKPTYGRVSRYGLIAFGSSLDQVSPFARSVRDVELVTHLMSGTDSNDATCLDEPRMNCEICDLKGLRIGVPKEYFGGGLQHDVRARSEEALALFEQLGAVIVPVSLPHSEHAIAVYYVVATAEASSNLARFEGVRFGRRVDGDGSLQGMFAATREAGFGPEVKRRILLGTYVLSAGYYDAWYGRALKVRTLLRRDFEAAFESCDVIVGPTSPEPAFALGSKKDDPVAMYLSDVLTVPVNLAGLPAASVPCGFVDVLGRALPVGLQIIGPHRADARVLSVARAFEEATSFAAARAPRFFHGARS
ncbi:MAG: Asp-tRNA(Asn)/Glu-tRNA(Gln) amidotransferase subunit GatA [Planctomycetota bacterium]|nr:Asp-tRNA(Asn)/Glu-tRNA(Gln) amidotransferase subunit GatA [Planctomycetota bacterium]